MGRSTRSAAASTSATTSATTSSTTSSTSITSKRKTIDADSDTLAANSAAAADTDEHEIEQAKKSRRKRTKREAEVEEEKNEEKADAQIEELKADDEQEEVEKMDAPAAEAEATSDSEENASKKKSKKSKKEKKEKQKEKKRRKEMEEESEEEMGEEAAEEKKESEATASNSATTPSYTPHFDNNSLSYTFAFLDAFEFSSCMQINRQWLHVSTLNTSWPTRTSNSDAADGATDTLITQLLSCNGHNNAAYRDVPVDDPHEFLKSATYKKVQHICISDTQSDLERLSQLPNLTAITYTTRKRHPKDKEQKATDNFAELATAMKDRLRVLILNYIGSAHEDQTPIRSVENFTRLRVLILVNTPKLPQPASFRQLHNLEYFESTRACHLTSEATLALVELSTQYNLRHLCIDTSSRSNVNDFVSLLCTKKARESLFSVMKKLQPTEWLRSATDTEIYRGPEMKELICNLPSANLSTLSFPGSASAISTNTFFSILQEMSRLRRLYCFVTCEQNDRDPADEEGEQKKSFFDSLSDPPIAIRTQLSTLEYLSIQLTPYHNSPFSASSAFRGESNHAVAPPLKGFGWCTSLRVLKLILHSATIVVWNKYQTSFVKYDLEGIFLKLNKLEDLRIAIKGAGIRNESWTTLSRLKELKRLSIDCEELDMNDLLPQAALLPQLYRLDFTLYEVKTLEQRSPFAKASNHPKIHFVDSLLVKVVNDSPSLCVVHLYHPRKWSLEDEECHVTQLPSLSLSVLTSSHVARFRLFTGEDEREYHVVMSDTEDVETASWSCIEEVKEEENCSESEEDEDKWHSSSEDEDEEEEED